MFFFYYLVLWSSSARSFCLNRSRNDRRDEGADEDRQSVRQTLANWADPTLNQQPTPSQPPPMPPPPEAACVFRLTRRETANDAP
ncbi:hypothetical protein GWI33_000004 [Rhynchophorus ferrugineus]|uniref:Secreted protein n=1 Tax=Rhynchophorus ferrugineus TaxID=354439 RepID=A0A834MPS1_RHYFE|nr:hypothetical protein GWI33_000004 [Rhynchophorus ferrugineus]